MASVALDGEVRLWDLQRKTCVLRGRCGSALARGAAWEPRHGERLYVVGDDKQVRVWDAAQGLDDEEVKEMGQPVDAIMAKGMLSGKKE